MGQWQGAAVGPRAAGTEPRSARRVHSPRAALLVLAGVLAFTALHGAWTAPVWAADFRTGDAVRITEPAQEDLYLAGSRILIEAPAVGDVLAAGGEITVRGEVGGSLLATGGNLSVARAVQGAIRAAGGNLSFTAPVGRDLIAAGGTLAVGPAARIGGDLVASAGNIRIEAPVEGDVRFAGGRFVLAAPVAGDVMVQADQVVLAEGARVGGDLVYRSANPAEIAQGAEVAGSIRRESPPPRATKGPIARVGSEMMLWFASIVAAAALLAIAPGAFAQARATARPPWRPVVAGVVALAAVPFAAFLAAITVVGLPVAITALLAYVVAIYAAQLFAGSWLGASIVTRVGTAVSGYWRELFAAALGMALLRLAVQLPVVGGWIRFGVLVVGVGLIANAVRASLRRGRAA